MSDEDVFTQSAVYAFLLALAAAIRQIDQVQPFSHATNLPRRTMLEALDGYLTDFGPQNPEHEPDSWAEICLLRKQLHHILKNPKLQLFDPSSGPSH